METAQYRRFPAYFFWHEDQNAGACCKVDGKPDFYRKECTNILYLYQHVLPVPISLACVPEVVLPLRLYFPPLEVSDKI